MDVVEIDAASHTGVDNIRELRSNATLRPARSRFKIYIIDEVHMLSTGAFNALLKTLEEPPEHVKFILATTEIQKVPATIQSRCQRFDFRAIDATAISKHLRSIVDREKIKVDDDVLRRIGRLGNGSMRDALSLLDKLLSYESNSLTSTVMDEIVPPPHDELAAALISRVAEQDAAGALNALDDALQTGRTVDRFCDRLIEHVRTLMLLAICGRDSDLVDVSEAHRTELHQQASKFDAPTYVYIISLLEELRRNVKFSGAARALADAAVVRLAMSRQFSDISAVLTELSAGEAPAGHASQVKRAAGVGPPQRGGEPPSRSAAPATSPVATTYESSAGPSSQRRDERGFSEGSRSAGPPPKRVSAEDRERVAADPLVQKVKESTDGMLLDIRPVSPTEPPDETGTAE
jgi:DNA polymerase-3 subunit gamma/tau